MGFVQTITVAGPMSIMSVGRDHPEELVLCRILCCCVHLYVAHHSGTAVLSSSDSAMRIQMAT